MSTSTPPDAPNQVHALARRWEFGSDADQHLRRLADGLSRPVTAWEVRECDVCPRRPLHIYLHGSDEPVTWADYSRAIPACKPPSRASRGGARRG